MILLTKLVSLLMKTVILLMKTVILLMKTMILLMKLMILLMKTMILLMKTMIFLLDFSEFSCGIFYKDFIGNLSSKVNSAIERIYSLFLPSQF